MYYFQQFISKYKLYKYKRECVICFSFPGCLTAILQVFLGVHAGVILMLYKDWRGRVVRWLLWATLYGCAGCALHFTQVISVNKNLW